MTKRFLQRARQLGRIPFVRRVATFQASSLVMMGTGLLSSVLYARLLGLEQFGLYAVVSSFAGVIGIVAAFGQETTLVTFLSEAIGRRDTRDVTRILRYFFQSSLLAILVYALLFFAAPQLSLWLQGDLTIGRLARYLLLNSMLQPAPVLVFLMLQLRGRVGAVSILENVRVLLQLTLATVLLLLGYGLEGILIATLTVSALYLPVCLHFYRTESKPLGFPSLYRIVTGLFGGETRKFFSQGLWIAFDRMIGSNLNPNLFFLVLNATASLEAVGLFRLAYKLSHLPSDLVIPAITRVSAVSIPLIVGQNRKALKSSCLKLIKGTLGMIVAAVIGGALFVPPLLPYVYGKEFAGAIPVFLLLLPYNIFAAMHVVSVPLARIFRRVSALVFFNLFSMIVAIGLYYPLTASFPAIVAICITVLLFHAISLLLYVYLWRVIKTERSFKTAT